MLCIVPTVWLTLAPAAHATEAGLGVEGCKACSSAHGVDQRKIEDLRSLVKCPGGTGEPTSAEYFLTSARETPGSDFEITRPRFTTGPAFNRLGFCERKSAALTCISKYSDAMKFMDIAIAAAAVREPKVTAFARKLARRLVTIIDARAKLDVLGPGSGRISTAQQKEIEATANQRLLTAFGNCEPNQAGCLAHACTKDAPPSCVATETRRLREAVAKGNLREAMFFLYISNDVLTQNVSRSPRPGESAAVVTRENEMQVFNLNAEIKARGQAWQITDIPTAYNRKYIIPRVGFGADNGRMRDGRQLGDGKVGCVPSTRTIRDSGLTSLELIPLSKRERVYLTNTLHVDDESLDRQPVPYYSGESCFLMKASIDDPKFQKYAPFLDHARDARIPLLTGISGTTDSLLGLGKVLGLKEPGDYQLLRVAALGWLVSAKDHSAHEVMTASQSFDQFKPRYRFRPDYYKSIWPSNPDFARGVERFARGRGQPLPQKILDSCLMDPPVENEMPSVSATAE